MNGKPEQLTVPLGVSSKFPVEALEELYKGIHAACAFYNVDLVGGDTVSSSSGLILSISVVGRVAKKKITYRKGAKSVTMIIREKKIGENIKYWVRPDIVNRIEGGEIKAHYQSEIKEIKEKSIIIKSPKGINEIDNDFVLAMTGYQPNYEILKKLGVKINVDEFKTPEYNEDTMETNVNGVYLAGVICGGLKTNKWFIENSRDHSEKIISDIIKN